MDLQRLTGLPFSSDADFKAIARPLSYIGLAGSQGYLADLNDHLTLHALASLPPGAHTPAEIVAAFEKTLKYKMEYDLVFDALNRLCARGQVYSKEVESEATMRYGVQPSRIKELTDEKNAQIQFEKGVMDAWRSEMAGRYPDLTPNDLNALTQDLTAFSYRLYSLHSVESVSLFFGDQANVQQLLDSLETRRIHEILPNRRQEMQDIRAVELPRFFREAPLERKKYIGQQLNSVFMLHMMHLDPTCACLAAQYIGGGKLFLDTNLLYRVFGLDGDGLQDAALRLLQLSRGLGYEPVVSPRTVQEYKRSIEMHVNRVREYPQMTEELARAALSATYQRDFTTHFWRRTADSRGYLDRQAYFDVFKKCEPLLDYYQIPIDPLGDDFVRGMPQEVVQEGLLLQRLVPEKERRSDSIIDHDAHMRLLILHLRAGNEDADPMQVPFWLLTCDAKLVLFDRRARTQGKSGLKTPYCVLTSLWLQLLRPFAAAVEGYNEVQADALDSPLFRLFRGPEPEMINEIITRLTQIAGLPTPVIVRAIADRAFVNAFADARDEQGRTEVLENYLYGQFISELEADRMRLADEIQAVRSQSSALREELEANRKALQENRQSQSVAGAQKAALAEALGAAKAGHEQQQTRLREAERRLNAQRQEGERLVSRIAELEQQEAEQKSAATRLLEQARAVNVQYEQALAEFKQRDALRQRYYLLAGAVLVVALLEVGLRPWTFPSKLAWLWLSILLVGFAAMQLIVIWGARTSVLHRSLVIFFSTLAVVAAALLPLGVDLPNALAIIFGAVQAVGVIFALVDALRKGEAAAPLTVPTPLLGTPPPRSQRSVTEPNALPLTFAPPRLAVDTDKSEALPQPVGVAHIPVTAAQPQPPVPGATTPSGTPAVHVADRETAPGNRADALLKPGKAGTAARLMAAPLRKAETAITHDKSAGRGIRKKPLRQGRAMPSTSAAGLAAQRRLVVAMLLVLGLVAVAAFSVPTIIRSIGDATISQDGSRLPVRDDFEYDQHSWRLGTYGDDGVDEDAQLVNGKYHIKVTAKRGAFRPFLAEGVLANDFRMQIQVKIVEASGNVGVGLVFRGDHDNYSVAMFRKNGTYDMSRKWGPTWESVKSNSPNPAITLTPGTTTLLGLKAKGSNCTVYANGKQLAEVYCSANSPGGLLGFAVELPQRGDSITAEFDKLIVEAP